MSFTNAQLAQQIADLLSFFDGREEELQDWMTGAVGGGVSSDGKYPLTDRLGTTVYHSSPAQLEDDVDNLVTGAAAHKVAAEAAQTAAEAAETAAETAATNALSYRDAALGAETDAQSAQSAAENAATNAVASAALAALWSSEDEDVVVSGGLYSALHHAAKAEASATAAAVAAAAGINGTVTGSLLKWTGSEWVEETGAKLRATGLITLAADTGGASGLAQAQLVLQDTGNTYSTAKVGISAMDSAGNGVGWITWYEGNLYLRIGQDATQANGEGVDTDFIRLDGWNGTALESLLVATVGAGVELFYNNKTGAKVIESGLEVHYAGAQGNPEIYLWDSEGEIGSTITGARKTTGDGSFVITNYRDAGNIKMVVTNVSGTPYTMIDGNYNGVALSVQDTKVIDLEPAKIGFFNVTPVSRPTISGSAGGNAALASLLAALEAFGLIIDSST